MLASGPCDWTEVRVTVRTPWRGVDCRWRPWSIRVAAGATRDRGQRAV